MDLASSKIKQIVLDKIPISVRQTMSPVLLNNLDLEIFTDKLVGRIFQLNSFVLGEIIDDVYCRYPENWWQAFRERFFPAWWLKKYPVRYVERNINVYRTYPFFNLSIPEDFGKEVIVWKLK